MICNCYGYFRFWFLQTATILPWIFYRSRMVSKELQDAIYALHEKFDDSGSSYRLVSKARCGRGSNSLLQQVLCNTVLTPLQRSTHIFRYTMELYVSWQQTIVSFVFNCDRIESYKRYLLRQPCVVGSFVDGLIIQFEIILTDVYWHWCIDLNVDLNYVKQILMRSYMLINSCHKQTRLIYVQWSVYTWVELLLHMQMVFASPHDNVGSAWFFMFSNMFVGGYWGMLWRHLLSQTCGGTWHTFRWMFPRNVHTDMAKLCLCGLRRSGTCCSVIPRVWINSFYQAPTNDTMSVAIHDPFRRESNISSGVVDVELFCSLSCVDITSDEKFALHGAMFKYYM